MAALYKLSFFGLGAASAVGIWNIEGYDIDSRV